MKTTASLILCLVGTLAIAADVSSASPEARSILVRPVIPPNTRHLAPGDEINVTISVTTALGAESVRATKSVIGADGKAELPELGKVQAAGLTLTELSRDIERRFSEGRGKGTQPTVMISKSNMDALSLQSAVAAGQLKRRVDSRPGLLDAPGPQYRDLRQEEGSR